MTPNDDNDNTSVSAVCVNIQSVITCYFKMTCQYWIDFISTVSKKSVSAGLEADNCSLE